MSLQNEKVSDKNLDLAFKKLDIKDKSFIDKFYKINMDISAEYNFATVFLWQDVSNLGFCIIENCLCVKNPKAFLYPIGKKEDVKKALVILYNYCKKEKINFVLTAITERMLEEIKEFDFENDFKIKEERDMFEYIYKTENLATLKGKKFHGNRNHLNYFLNNYEYSFVDIDETNINKIKEKMKSIIFEKSISPEDEYFVVSKTIDYREELNFICKCLIVDEEIIGLIVGEELNGTALIHIAKADTTYRGASVMLFKYFASNYLSELEYTNFMEDMGIDGIRRMKLSYKPEFLIEKYDLY